MSADGVGAHLSLPVIVLPPPPTLPFPHRGGRVQSGFRRRSLEMRLVQAASLDSIDDYRLIEGEKPRPGPGEVVIRIAACGLGYVDALVALGRYQVKPPLPHTPGQEVGGVVEAVGEGVDHLAAGDRVMATVRGGFAESRPNAGGRGGEESRTR